MSGRFAVFWVFSILYTVAGRRFLYSVLAASCCPGLGYVVGLSLYYGFDIFQVLPGSRYFCSPHSSEWSLRVGVLSCYYSGRILDALGSGGGAFEGRGISWVGGDFADLPQLSQYHILGRLGGFEIQPPLTINRGRIRFGVDSWREKFEKRLVL